MYYIFKVTDKRRGDNLSRIYKILDAFIVRWHHADIPFDKNYYFL